MCQRYILDLDKDDFVAAVSCCIVIYKLFKVEEGKKSAYALLEAFEKQVRNQDSQTVKESQGKVQV